MLNLNRLHLTLLLLICTPVSAHNDGSHIGKNGGEMTQTSFNQIELVRGDDKLEIYITDSGGEPRDMDGVKVVVIVLHEGKQLEHSMQFLQPNKFTVVVGESAKTAPVVLKLLKEDVLWDLTRFEPRQTE